METKSFKLFNKQNLPLRGQVWIPSRQKRHPIIIVCHGFKGFNQWGFFPHTAEQIAKAGFMVVTFNFSGSGIGDDLQNFTELKLFEENTYTRELDDLQTIINMLISGRIGDRVGNFDRIGLLGHSRGGGTAVLTASKTDNIRCLVTWSAISTVDRFSKRETESWESRGYIEVLNSRTQQLMRINRNLERDISLNKERLNILSAVGRINMPYLIIHGKDDEAVPLAEARAIYEAANPNKTQLKIVEGAGHTFNVVHPFEGTNPAFDDVLTSTIEWFEFWLKK